MARRFVSLDDYVSRELFDHVIDRLAAKQQEVERLQNQITAMIIDPDRDRPAGQGVK